MHKKFYYLPAYIFFSTIISGYIFSQPAFISVNENSGNIGKYEKYELTIILKTHSTNPYDPEAVSLKGFFKSPSGKLKVVDGFFIPILQF